MISMTRPIWLTLRNGEGKSVSVIFKMDDDLRTDILVLQLMRIMDAIWKSKGKDLHMQTYTAFATGPKEGLIAVVPNSKTLGEIQQSIRAGVNALFFAQTALVQWLEQQNKTPEEFQTAVNNFVLSCAGYSVATYILGVRDRHNDNIMCSTTGNLCHIDFGHILNKADLPVIPDRAEVSPFALPQEFLYVMGADGFKLFVEICCEAYGAAGLKLAL